MCYKHSADDPVTKIKIQKCEPEPNTLVKRRCHMKKENYAWIDADMQFASDFG